MPRPGYLGPKRARVKAITNAKRKKTIRETAAMLAAAAAKAAREGPGERSVTTLKKKAITQRKIDRLLTHPRNQFIRKVNDRAFEVTDPRTDRKILYKGLTKKCKAAFWPLTEEDPKLMSAEEIKRRQQTPVGKVKKPKKRRSCAQWGARHGTQVHGEIQLWTNLVRRDGLTRGTDAFCVSCRYPDPCTVELMRECARNDWLPIASEFMIWDEELRLATAIDLVVYEFCSHELVGIELKTGHEWLEYMPIPTDPPLKSPLDRLSDCPLNRHQLQLVVPDMILKKKYGMYFDRFVVVRVCPAGKNTQTIPMCSWTKDPIYRHNIYEALSP